MKLQDSINKMIKELSGETTNYLNNEFEETHVKIKQITKKLKLLFKGKRTKIEIFETTLIELANAYFQQQIITEEQGYYKGLRDGLKLASNFEIMGIPVQVKLLDKPQIQLQITNVDSPGDNEPV